MSRTFGTTRVPLADSACWMDDVATVTAVTKGANKGRKIKFVTDGRRRPAKSWTSAMVVHTHKGTARTLKKGLIESVTDWVLSSYQTNTDREVSWHVTGDTDGSVIQQADSSWTCWQASQVNPFMDGMELVEAEGGVLTDVQLEAFVKVMDIWTYHTGIPRLIPWAGGVPFRGMLTRCLSAHGAGRSVCGIIGHRNIWGLNKSGKLIPYRGAGDPSDLPFYALKEAGYKTLDMEKGEDLEYWKAVQLHLGEDPDGVCGPSTRKAMWKEGQPGSLLVSRPGDATLGVPAWLIAAA